MKIANSPCCSTSPEVPLPSPKQPDIGSRVMSSAPPLAASMGKKKKKKSNDVTSDTPSVAATNASPTSSPIEDADSLTRAIQTALDHAQAAGVIPTSNPAIDQGEASSPKSKKRHATGTPDDSGSALPDGSQKKSKKKKTSVNSAATSSSGLSPAIANHTSSTATSNASQHIPGYLNGSHIPIDPALTVNDQAIQRHSHQSISNPNSPFTGALTPAAAAALQPQEATASGNYLFNQETDLSVLASNEDILRALQLEGFDMNKFAGALKSYTESLASANSAATSGHPQTNETGPSAGASLVTTPQPVAGPSGSGSKSRAKKVVAPQPGSQVVNPEHADILATHWLNPAKLAELVKDQGLVYKKGKFSAIEEHQIEAALQHYATAKNLTPSEIDAIIFSKGKKAKEEYSTFWSEITRAVPQRPIIAVYHHVRRTHHPMKQQGKWTPEEDAIVIAAVAELGQKWEQISLRVGRMSSDCRDRYRNHLVDQDARVVGPWTKEEEEELTKIVMELTVERGLQADNDVLWSEVSERMGGRRTRQQVRIKWTDALNKRVKNAGERPRWSAQDAYILVHKVASMPVQDDTEIDWKLLPDPQWNLWSAHQLQRRWYGLKKTLKDADTTPHSEIIAILQSKFRDPPEQPNASRRYETKKSRNIALGREFITDEDDNFDEFADTAGAHDLFSQSADGTPLDHDLVRAAQQQLEAVLEIASQQAAASGSGTRET